MSRPWATGRPKSLVTGQAKVPTAPDQQAPDQQAPDTRAPGQEAPDSRAPGQFPGHGVPERATAIAADWAPAVGRILLGVVFAWFGYHELIRPGEWTQYVPVVSESSSFAVILVLAHGWVLFVTAAALVAGIAPRAAAAVASVLMLEIVISLAATGLSDTALRDVGVLGLAVCLTGVRQQRLVLRN
jgi:uncharacterized membrane protein YphA (DoxX/SURF4 family)